MRQGIQPARHAADDDHAHRRGFRGEQPTDAGAIAGVISTADDGDGWRCQVAELAQGEEDRRRLRDGAQETGELSVHREEHSPAQPFGRVGETPALLERGALERGDHGARKLG